MVLMGTLLLLPAMAAAESGYSYGEQAGASNVSAGQTPIGQALVREGDFAVKLAPALSLGTSRDEVEAENQLTAAGIMPKNGWIADYPVTPDIVDELHRSVRDAAATGKINMGVDAAILKTNEVMAQSGLALDTQATAPVSGGAEQAGPPSYPNPTVINNYYQAEGPPVVTYYAPPPDYSYMYGWVPYPFWCNGFFFSGFFILHDFHRTVFIDNRAVFVSNHFRDIGRQRIIRLDPIERSRGNNIANTRVIRTRGSVPASGTIIRERAIMRAPRMQTVPNSSLRRPTVGRGLESSNFRSSVSTTPSAASGVSVSNTPIRSARSFSVTRSESAVMPTMSSHGNSGMSGRGGRMMSMPSRSGGFEGMPFRGNSSMGGRGRR